MDPLFHLLPVPNNMYSLDSRFPNTKYSNSLAIPWFLLRFQRYFYPDASHRSNEARSARSEAAESAVALRARSLAS
jgi:hypothetical protein